MAIAGPFFRKLLLGSLLLILVAVVFLDALLTRYTAQRELRSVEQDLRARAQILTAEMQDLPPEALAQWVLEARSRAGARLTVIAPDGKVLAESDQRPDLMENHASRPEVKEALAGRIGSASRYSDSVKREMFYLAMPVKPGAVPGQVLRLAVPAEQVERAVGEVRWRILEVSLAAAILSLGAAFLLASSLNRRIQQLQRFAEGLVAARFDQELPRGPKDEIGALATSLNGMARQLRDMLERLRLEAMRREAILSSMVEGVLAVDHELCVVFCNETFARAVRASHPVAERLPVLELVRDPALLEMLAKVLVENEQQKRRLQLAAAEGRTYQVHAAPLELMSGRGAIAVLHDITDLERLERVRRDFVANVSHELRTPLAAIQGYAETLLDGGLEDAENKRRFVEIIKAHAARLNNIASDLLALSELESADAGPPPEKISVADAVEAAVTAVESEAALRKIRLHRSAGSDLYATANKIRLEQVLVNLIDNAVKFNRPGGEVWIEAARLDEGKIRISVEDNGIGIPSAELPRIFERFYRVDKARSREAGGTGLGLSIVKHAVERMGGSVSAESQLGKGSKFTVVLPEG